MCHSSRPEDVAFNVVVVIVSRDLLDQRSEKDKSIV